MTKVEQAAETRWTNRWPTSPGRYLFCCRIKGDRKDRPRLMLVDTHKNYHGHVLHTGGGLILFPSEWEGVWKPYTDPLPELEALLNPPASVIDQLNFKGFRPALANEDSDEWTEVTLPSGAREQLRVVALRLEVGDPK